MMLPRILMQINVCSNLIKKVGAKSGLSKMEHRGMFSTAASVGKPNKMEPFTVFVEGNIGSGKTTFLKHFAAMDNIATFPEPVDKWRDVRGHNLLDLMYRDPTQWGLTFQTYVQLTMLRVHTQPVKARIKMIERSIHSARFCFVENLHNKGVMREQDFVVLDEWYDWITKTHNISGNLFVYLRTTPEVVHKRMKARARTEESCVPFEYLEQLHEVHEDWLYHGTKFSQSAPVVVIDANQDFDDMKIEFSKFEKQIKTELLGCSTKPPSPRKLTCPPPLAKSSVG